MRRQIGLLIIIVLLLLGTLSGCKHKDDRDPNDVAVTGITLSSESEIMLIDNTVTLSAEVMPENATNKKISWASSYEEIAKVNDDGKVTAKGTGIVTISATTEDGDYTADAVFYIGNAIVGEGYENTEGYNTTIFSTIGEAITAVEDKQVIIINQGDYDESLSIDKSVNLIGVGYPKLRSIVMTKEDSELRVRGVCFENEDFPHGGEATIKGAVDGELHIYDCKFRVLNEGEPTGGYAIYASLGTDKVIVKSSEIDNYRYGIYSHRAGATYDITNNTFTNLKTGIGLDIRVPNSTPPLNYAAMGTIGDNTFLNVETRALMYFNGDDYDGNLQFDDFISGAED